MEKVNILIADDDKIFSELTRFVLEEHDFNVYQAYELDSTISFISLKQIDLIILDLHFPRYEDGITALKEIKDKFPQTPVIMVTSEYVDIIIKVVEALKCGAYDFVEKPIKEERLVLTIKNALEIASLKTAIGNKRNKSIDLIGNSPQMNEIFGQIQVASRNSNPVLITGEHGTGKKIIAKSIHNLSDREINEAVIINCATINKDYFEQEFLGLKNKTSNNIDNEYFGKLELANETTLIIDNIDIMPLNSQKQLVKFIKTNSFNKPGNMRLKELDVKVIAVTNKDLSDSPKFSKELIELLSVNTIFVPPLRERIEDIRPIVEFFTEIINEANHVTHSFSEEVITQFEKLAWKGNIRELQTKVISLLINSANEIITEVDLNQSLMLNDDLLKLPYKSAMKILEKDYLINLLNYNHWNVAESAKSIGIDRTNLFKKMKNHNIKPQQKNH